MTVKLDASKTKIFEDLFEHPSLDAMHALSPDDFELFVGHVFHSAGYGVQHVGRQYFPEGPGLDFNLYADEIDGHMVGDLIARVEVRRYAKHNMISLDAVMSVIGRLHINEDVPGFIVTTSDFYPAARVAESKAPNLLRLVNGDHFVRYIRYIGGSRYTDQRGRLRTPTRVSPSAVVNADHIPRRDPCSSRVLSVANNKGGIGKTTATLNLGFALAQQGNRVLVVDTDGQASLTLALPPPADGPEPRGSPMPPHAHTVAEFFSGRVQTVAELVQRTRFEHLWILPAHADLHRMDVGGGAQPERELRFVRALHDAALCVPDGEDKGKAFDWILIDTPPAQSFYTRAAIAASHGVIIPLEVEAFAARGVSRAASTIRAMHGLVGSGAEILGVVMTNWKPVPAAQKDKLTQLHAELLVEKIELLLPEIPYDDKVDVAHLSTIRGQQKSIFGIGAQPRPAAKGYVALLKTVKERMRHAYSCN